MAQVDVGSADDFPEGEKKVLDVNGQRILLTRVDGTVRAVQGKCSHQGADFAIAGKVNGHVLHCRMHGASFDLVNGQRATLGTDLAIFKVHEEGGRVFVEV
jgi:nitrite reductase/ring-hydroxylating ferredoxin subunit